jgi:hypothetical protein
MHGGTALERGGSGNRHGRAAPMHGGAAPTRSDGRRLGQRLHKLWRQVAAVWGLSSSAREVVGRCSQTTMSRFHSAIPY